MTKIFVVGGGTGGHLFPAIAAAEELIKRGYNVHLITDDRCVKYLKNHAYIKTHIINSSGFRDGLFGKITAVFKVLSAFFQTVGLFVHEKPKLVITFGGYVAFTPLLCASMLRIPSMLHEQNCFFGKVNRWFASRATKILLTFKATKNIPLKNDHKIIISGNPVRDEISNIRAKKDFQANPFRIAVIGGSQGAKVFSDLVPKAIEIAVAKQPKVKIAITQQVKVEDIEFIAAIYKKCDIDAKLSDFFYNMPEILAGAHLVIARSGASTIAELIALGCPAIFVPYPFAAEKHQHFNAEVIAKNGGGWCINQDVITAEILADRILLLENDRALLQKASKNLADLKMDAVNIIANSVEKVITSLKK